MPQEPQLASGPPAAGSAPARESAAFLRSVAPLAGAAPLVARAPDFLACGALSRKSTPDFMNKNAALLGASAPLLRKAALL